MSANFNTLADDLNLNKKMKKILFVATLAMTLFSCSKVKKGEFLITGTAKGIENGKTVILQKQDESGLTMVPVDTVKIKDGKFEIKGKINEPTFCSILLPEFSNGFGIIIENDEIKVEVNKDSIQNSIVSGTYNNDELYKFGQDTKKIKKKIDKKMMDFQTKNMPLFNEAQKNKDTAAISKIMKEANAIQKELTDSFDKYAESHPKSFISIFMINGMFQSPNMEIEKIKKLYNSLDEDLKNTSPGKRVKTQIEQFEKVSKAQKAKPVAVGTIAPDFSAKDPNGKMVSLKSSLGKVTLIDFWASWCGPCRKENPNVVALYNEFHSKGLNIVGVSLDEDLNEWKQAIVKDKITWIQISNLKKWQDPIAKMYNIEQIPTTFLLDASGRIIAQDLRGDELKAKVKALLG